MARTMAPHRLVSRFWKRRECAGKAQSFFLTVRIESHSKAARRLLSGGRIKVHLDRITLASTFSVFARSLIYYG
jgi:hypothetical protein